MNNIYTHFVDKENGGKFTDYSSRRDVHPYTGRTRLAMNRPAAITTSKRSDLYGLYDENGKLIYDEAEEDVAVLYVATGVKP